MTKCTDMDTRNVLDEFKGQSIEEIKKTLDGRGVSLEVAIENLERDFNMGTIVRNANAFGVRNIHIVGRKQWNKRGAMMTDKYLNAYYYASAQDFVSAMRKQNKKLVAIENNVESVPLGKFKMDKNLVLIFGAEGTGITSDLLSEADTVVHIEQLGSTRSLNVGVASGIAMHEWSRQNVQNI